MINDEPSMGDDIKTVSKSSKQLMQLAWIDITITADPPTGRCTNKSGQIKEQKVIIDNAHGTVQPG
jgi:hypothetical protein